MLGKNGETCIYLRMGRRCVASANVPEDLSLSGTSGFQGAGDTMLEVFIVLLFYLFIFFVQGGVFSVGPPTHVYIMYILYVCVYHKMKYVCLHVWCTLFWHRQAVLCSAASWSRSTRSGRGGGGWVGVCWWIYLGLYRYMIFR